MQGKKATITILDFRNMMVIERILDASDKIIFEIDKETFIEAKRLGLPIVLIDEEKYKKKIGQNLRTIRKELNQTQEDLAKKLGKTQSTVANKLRLLNLDEDVQEALLEEKISERHARSLLRLNDSNQQKMMLKKITDERLTVRKADDFIAKILKGENVFNKPESVITTQNVEIPTFNNAFLPNENLIEIANAFKISYRKGIID